MLTSTLRLLAATTNEKGDLFTRLMKDFFFAVGYEELQYDVAKTGREIDVQGQHRIESKLLRAECKAHQDKMGGAEVNKFRGALMVERAKSTKQISGYFLSLGGFTANALEQELELGDDAINLVDVSQIIKELEGRRILASDHEVAERSGRIAERANLQDVSIDGIELLGHQTGYVKVVYYASNRVRTHFALLHYRTPLGESAASEIIEADKLNGGVLHKLTYLLPAPPTPEYIATEEAVMEHYHRWLSEECGFIQLDGLPADASTSPKKLELERLFVPLRAIVTADSDAVEGASEFSQSETIPIGELLTSHNHLALLAAPGGGKSTLLKRLATAYAFSERREQIADKLPERDWMPLFLRCRELRERAGKPILTLLEMIPAQMSMPEQEAAVFNQVVIKALRAGQILLLVDGLDEISDEKARKAFAQNLRVFLAVYPQTSMVVTSREAGYRLVAGVIADACQHAKLAPLEETDVAYLCMQWHMQVVRDTPQVREEALELARNIWHNGRIRMLAENPLLLTTLLVVKRWIGQLPRNRVALYGAAVKVLIMTWNVEGFEPLEEDETLTQLSYVACAMMELGVQQISYRQLLKLLQEARQELEAELQSARISPADFIKRVEYRSSILMRTGQEVINGELQDVYEFRHLTFQEYLAARGYANAEYPGWDNNLTLSDTLTPHLIDERWREVVPLTAVLAKRQAENLIKQLVEACEQIDPGAESEEDERYMLLLYQCILDEVIASPAVVGQALKQLGRLSQRLDEITNLGILFEGKYAERLKQIAQEEFISSKTGWDNYARIYDLAVSYSNYFLPEKTEEIGLEDIIQYLETGDSVQRTNAALKLKELNYDWKAGGFEELMQSKMILTAQPLKSSVPSAVLDRLANVLRLVLAQQGSTEQLAACWALAWIADGPIMLIFNPALIAQLYDIWRTSTSPIIANYAAAALAYHVISNRYDLASELEGVPEFLLNKEPHRVIGEIVLNKAGLPIKRTETLAAVIIGWYARAPWKDQELASKIERYYRYLSLPTGDYTNQFELYQATCMLAQMGKSAERLMRERAALEKAVAEGVIT